MKAISIPALRKALKAYFESVSRSMEWVLLSRKKKGESIGIMSSEEYNSFKETEFLLSTEANRKRLQQSISQAAEGITVCYD